MTDERPPPWLTTKQWADDTRVAERRRGTLLRMLKRYALQQTQEGEEPFTLSSGQRSDWRLATHRVTYSPTGLYLASDVLAHLIFEHTTELEDEWPALLAGVPTGGQHLAAALVSFVHRMTPTGPALAQARIEAGWLSTRPPVEIPSSTTAKDVFVVEDVVTTGRSANQVVRSFAESGYHVLGVVALLDRREHRDVPMLSEVPLYAAYVTEDLFKKENRDAQPQDNPAPDDPTPDGTAAVVRSECG